MERNKIEISREKIREQLLEVLAKNIKLSDKSQLDTNSTSFSTYFINAASYLVSDLLFYNSTIYDETSLVSAKLPSSIHNWATYLAYKPRKAKPAKAKVLVDIAIDRSFVCEIPYLHKFYSNGIIFRSDYKYIVEAGPVSYKVISIDPKTGGQKPIPYDTYSKNSKPHLVFLVDVTQFDIIDEYFAIPDLEHFEFFTKDIEIPSTSYLYDVLVTTEFNNTKYQWTENKLILSYPTDRNFELAFKTNNQFTIVFGNGIYGRQPKGLANIKLYITEGEAGNVLPGAINRIDSISSVYPLDIKAINVEAAKDGVNEETYNDIKRNAIINLTALQRLVSEDDFKNANIITDSQNISKCGVVLKRSDLTTNNIFVYVSLHYNNKIVPTNTIPIVVPKNLSNVPPFYSFQHENYEWICPYSIEIKEKQCYFHNVSLKRTLPIQLIYKRSETPISNIISVKQTYNSDDDTYILTVNSSVKSENTVVDQHITLYSTNKQYNIQPTSVTNSKLLYQFTYKIKRYDLQYITNIHITNINKQTNTEDVIYQAFINYSKKLTEQFMFSDIKEYDSTYNIIYDVPVILKDYWLSLDDKQKNELLNYLDKQLYEISVSYKHKLLNSTIATKFIRTYGQLENLKYSSPDYYVIGIYNNSNDFPDAKANSNSYLAFHSENSDDVNFEQSGRVFLSTGTEWIPLEISRGTLVKTPDNELYATTGSRWVKPKYKVPMKMIVEVYTSHNDSSLVDKVKQTIIDYLNSLDAQESVYQSRIIDRIMDIKEVSYCRIIYPEVDIIYRDTAKNLTRNELLVYTPEQIWTEKDLIKVIVRYVTSE